MSVCPNLHRVRRSTANPQLRRILGAVALSLLCCTLLTMLVGTASAGEDKYAGEFLKLGVGARALAMGGAFVAIANDASAAYWNPAGLALLDQGELIFMHSEHFGSLANHDYIGFAQPLSNVGRLSSVGIGLLRWSVDDIKITKDAFDDENGNNNWEVGEQILPSQFRSGSDHEYGLFLSYSREIRDRWFFGGNVKLLRQGLLDNTSFGMGADLGLLYMARSNLTFGARLADATTTQISWDTGHRETVMPTLALGFQWTKLLAPLNGSVTLAGDLTGNLDGRDEASQLGSGADLQGGMEYWYGNAVAARVGSDAGNFTAGAGLRHRGFGVDYAFLSHEDFDDTHRISGSVRF